MSIGLPPLSPGLPPGGALPSTGEGTASSAPSVSVPAQTANATAAAPQISVSASAPISAEAALAEAVAQARATAAAQPGGMAPLLADLAEAVRSVDLPDPIRETANQILSLGLPADQVPTADDIRTAFERTGPVTESRLAVLASASTNETADGASLTNGSLASGSANVSASALAGGDLKSLLLVLRQALSALASQADGPDAAAASSAKAPTSLPAQAFVQTPASGSAVQTAAPQGTASQMPLPASVLQGLGAPVAPDNAASVTTAATSAAVPSSLPIDTTDILAASAAPLASGDDGASAVAFSAAAPLATAAVQGAVQSGVAFSTLALLQAMGLVKSTQSADRGSISIDTASDSDVPDTASSSSQSLPVKGGATSAQSPARATLPDGGNSSAVSRHLLADSETALAHQKLLQIASLPDADPGAKPASTHWMFEIPLATPNGPAIAQFAIDKDGGGQADGEDKETVWRARFSVDIEPLGPVHAGIALGAEKTFVTLWADRRASLQALKDNAEALALSLNEAELNAEIAFRPVLTPKPVAVGSGHFLDRMS